jgi:hypothetical protein
MTGQETILMWLITMPGWLAVGLLIVLLLDRWSDASTDAHGKADRVVEKRGRDW